jgi:hypothetical protein
VTPPTEVADGIPRALEAVILWALEKDRDRRASSARELRTALRAFLAGQAGTIPALASYGVETIPDTSPWSGPTPYWQLDLPAPPRHQPSGILAAPPPPPQLTPLPEVESETPTTGHLDLVADLDIASSEGPPAPGGASPRDRAAPPRGAHVPAHLVDASSPWEERSEIFSDRSYFQSSTRSRERLTMDPGEVRLEAPPPRSLSRAADSDTLGAPAARDAMATYLWERFGMSPDRRIPPDGFWIRDAAGRELGPCTWSELTRALRLEAAGPGAGDVSVSSDQRSWISAERFVQLTGVEAILDTSRALPDPSPLSGRLEERSAASVFAELTRRAATGRMMFQVESGPRQARFEIHLDEGKPTFVFTNEPHLQLPDLLIAKGLLSEDRLPTYIRAVLSRATTLEEAVSRDAPFDVAQYRAAAMKERLRHLVRWPGGAFALDDSARPASHMAFAVSLLSLLPDLVYRTLSSQYLEATIRPLLEARPRRAPNANVRLAAMGLTRSQRGVAERILSCARLADVLPADGRVRKAYTTMAYVLREAGLFEI